MLSLQAKLQTAADLTRCLGSIPFCLRCDIYGSSVAEEASSTSIDVHSLHYSCRSACACLLFCSICRLRKHNYIPTRVTNVLTGCLGQTIWHTSYCLLRVCCLWKPPTGYHWYKKLSRAEKHASRLCPACAVLTALAYCFCIRENR